MNNINESNLYGSLNDEDGIQRTNSTIADQIMGKRTPNKQIISLETREEKRHRKISLYISCATLLFYGICEGMLNISIWPYMKKVIEFGYSVRKVNKCMWISCTPR